MGNRRVKGVVVRDPGRGKPDVVNLTHSFSQFSGVVQT